VTVAEADVERPCELAAVIVTTIEPVLFLGSVCEATY
jgi:hypothetical protein